jgi:FkbM family methyltransferase
MLAAMGMFDKTIIRLSDLVLKAGTRVIRGAASMMRKTTDIKRRDVVPGRIWIDVGAHRGETTFHHARENPDLVVYAFEPDVAIASHRYSLLPNFIVVPMAVSEVDGLLEFNINSNPRTSSLLPLDEDVLKTWQGAEGIRTVRKVLVPAIRLDTFLDSLAVESVEYLKIDAQGHDLEVVRSLGKRLHDVARIRLEACAAGISLYVGAHNRATDVVTYMTGNGFELVEDEPESRGQERNMVFLNVTHPVNATAELEQAKRQ